MTDDTTWVCGSCRSINPSRADRCYACRSPRSLAMDPLTTPPTALPKVVRDDAPPEERVQVARQAGARWEPTDRLAWLARTAVIAVSVVTLAKIAVDVQALQVVDGAAGAEVELSVGLVPSLATGVMAVAWMAGFVVWGAWLSRVVANVPALGGGWPGTGPTAAFVSAIIPVANLVWGTAVLRDVVVRLSPPGGARLGLLTAWWIALVAAALPWVGRIPGQTAVIRVAIRLVTASLAGLVTGATGSSLAAAELAEVVAGLLVLVAAGLAIWLVDRIEDLQDVRRADLGVAA